MPEEEDEEEVLPKPWCEECHGLFRGEQWYPSFFKDIFVCHSCNEKEKYVIDKLQQSGKDLRKYEGCGYIPKI